MLINHNKFYRSLLILVLILKSIVDGQYFGGCGGFGAFGCGYGYGYGGHAMLGGYGLHSGAYSPGLGFGFGMSGPGCCGVGVFYG